MASGSSSPSGRIQSTNPKTVSRQIPKISAYNDNFEQYLIDNNIFPQGYRFPNGRLAPKPNDIDCLRQELSVARASLSLSTFSESAFEEFSQKNRTCSEGTAMRNVIPIITGDSKIPNEGHLPFINLSSLTNNTTTKPVPDFFDGAHPESIHKTIRIALNQMIIPTKHAATPILPTFFLEAKAPRGDAHVARRQACYNGAYGARAMHILQNYGETEPIFDGNSDTISAIFYEGNLELFAHHVRAPASAETQPEYYMTKLRGFHLTDSRETFIAGATAFRNARDFAARHRDRVIQTANAKVSGVAVREDILHIPRGCQPVSSVLSQEAGEPQQQVADTDDTNENGEEALDVRHYMADDSQDHVQQSVDHGFDEASMSFASSFTSMPSGNSVPSKPQKHSISPPSTVTEQRTCSDALNKRRIRSTAQGTHHRCQCHLEKELS